MRKFTGKILFGRVVRDPAVCKIPDKPMVQTTDDPVRHLSFFGTDIDLVSNEDRSAIPVKQSVAVIADHRVPPMHRNKASEPKMFPDDRFDDAWHLEKHFQKEIPTFLRICDVVSRKVQENQIREFLPQKRFCMAACGNRYLTTH